MPTPTTPSLLGLGSMYGLPRTATYTPTSPIGTYFSSLPRAGILGMYGAASQQAIDPTLQRYSLMRMLMDPEFRGQYMQQNVPERFQGSGVLGSQIRMLFDAKNRGGWVSPQPVEPYGGSGIIGSRIKAMFAAKNSGSGWRSPQPLEPYGGSGIIGSRIKGLFAARNAQKKAG